MIMTTLWFWEICVIFCVAVAFYFRDVLSGSLPCDGKHVLITGCDTGFGNMIAKKLDAAGYYVHACCLSVKSCRALREGSSTGRLTTHVLDVTNMNDVESVAGELKKSGVELWGLINNAGVMKGSFVEFTPTSDFEMQMNVNYFGVVRVTKALIPLIQSGGRIVNVVSSVGYLSAPMFSSYCATKFAVRAFTDSLRVEMLPWNIKVSIVAPGIHFTDMIDNGLKFVTDAHKNPSKEVASRYGNQFGSRVVATSNRVARFFKSVGIGNPDNVVDAMHRAVRSRTPKSRYIVGTDAYSSIALSHLPAFITDRYFMYTARLFCWLFDS